MEPIKRALDIKYDRLLESLKLKYSFTVEDAQIAWGSKKSTTYWDLHKLVETGRLNRIQNGIYSFVKRSTVDVLIPSGFAGRIQRILKESGFPFYISGVDVLLRFMQHIPDQYPVILFADKLAVDEILNLLVEEGIIVIFGKESKASQDILNRNRMENVVLLYKTQNFSYSLDGFATNEKAFVDLYFEMTRRSYPLAMQEWARMYISMMEQGELHRGKLLQAAHERSIRSEMILLIDAKQINPSALKLAEMIQGEE
jgi:hypothetical protein